MLKKVVDLTSQDFSKGLNTISNILNLSKDQSPNMMNVKVNFDGSIEKRLGSNTQNTVVIATSGSSAWLADSGNTLNSGIQAYWKLDEASGTRMDSIGDNDLSDNGNVGQASGIKNAAALFSSSASNYLLKESTQGLTTGDINFSMSTWFYLNQTSTTIQQTLISKRDSGSGDNTLLLIHCDGVDGSTTFTDNSSYAHTITASNAQVDTGIVQFGTGSLEFTANNGYLSIPNSSIFNFGTGDFTVDLWLYIPTNDHQILISDGGETDWINFYFQVNQFALRIEGSATMNWSHSLLPATWHHVALQRSGSTVTLFVDGSSLGTQTDSSNITTGFDIIIGDAPTNPFTMVRTESRTDEFRISNVARYTGNFVVPTSPYSDATNGSQYEYWLFLNTDNQVVFRVSSSGTTHNGQVIASSFGAVTTANWYNVVAWHDTADVIGISVNLSVNSAAYASGVRAGSAPFVIGAVSNGASNFINSRIDETGFWKKVLTAQNRIDLYNGGSGNTFSNSFSGYPWASFDFGAGSNRWLTVAAGTGIYASNNLGVSFVTIASSRTATYQAFERSKNILIATSEAYDSPIYWTGSSGTQMAILSGSAPLAKYCINFQGFTILLNTSERKRGFFYQDENSHITGNWANSFDLPSSADDEITSAFVLRGTLYVTTRYALFRLTYVGGNPDWSFRLIKFWGFVSRTPKIITIKDVGEVCCGMSWDLKIRLFDGSDDKIISDNIENNNMMCDFSMDSISFTGSGPLISFAENDSNEQNYKLCVAIGTNSQQTTHFINFNGRTQAFFPYSNMNFNTMVMAESANQRFLMAFDRLGYCHMMGTGNLDGGTTPIKEVFDSALLYEKSPSEVSKSQKIDLYLSPTSSGTLKYFERIDFSSNFKFRDDIILDDTTNKVLIKKSINIPVTQGVYQYRLTSSNVADPWKLNRIDYFLTALGIGQNENR